MKRLCIEQEDILYRNPRPGYRAECAFLTNIIPLSDRELLCFFRLGQAFYSVDGKLAILRSKDAGQNWSLDGFVWDPANDNHPYSYSLPHGTKFSDGRLAVIARRNDCVNPDQTFFNPSTGGAQMCDIVIFFSHDQGQNWSAPNVLDLPGEGLTDTPSQIIELNDGRWFLGCESWKGWDDTSPLHIKCFGVFSDDRGKTWGDRIDLPGAAHKDKMYSHSRFKKMKDGRIGALQWTQEIGGNKDFDLHLIKSDTSGKKWSEPQPTGIQGQTCCLADLGDGLLAAAYTSRTGTSPGIYVILSEDGGITWDMDHQVMVWDAAGQEFLGVVHKADYPVSHDNIAFGKPDLARVSDDTLICSWWCTQACVTHTRFARLKIH
jgi:hypothetical protein